MAYRTPPIVEATIELRLKEGIPFSDAERASKKLASSYATSKVEREIEFQVDTVTGQAINSTEKTVGFRLDSSDNAEILFVRVGLLAGVQLAPYPGWEVFRDRVKRDWQKFRRIVGVQKLSRIGVRYQNRIDVPRSFAAELRADDFLNILPRVPSFGSPTINGYSMTVLLPFAKDNCKVRIVTGMVPSPVPDAVALLLDIDMFAEVELPIKESDIWSLLERMRQHKNVVFEACVTAKARELFHR